MFVSFAVAVLAGNLAYPSQLLHVPTDVRPPPLTMAQSGAWRWANGPTQAQRTYLQVGTYH
jgi:hypothetical protein